MQIGHKSAVYNIGTHTLPDMYALSPRVSGIHIRQITHALVITNQIAYAYYA